MSIFIQHTDNFKPLLFYVYNSLIFKELRRRGGVALVTRWLLTSYELS